MNLPPTLKPDFDSWLQKVPHAKNEIKIDSYSIEIYSHASKTGWGAFCNGQRCHGWSELKQRDHINVLELRATFMVLKTFASNMSHCNVLCRVDNSTTLAYINRMGSVQFSVLNR